VGGTAFVDDEDDRAGDGAEAGDPRGEVAPALFDGEGGGPQGEDDRGGAEQGAGQVQGRGVALGGVVGGDAAADAEDG
jgi:hypothetical protein